MGLGGGVSRQLEKMAAAPKRRRSETLDDDGRPIREFMNVKASHSMHMPEMEAVESWACPSNHLEGALGLVVGDARDALVRLVDNGDQQHVTTLWLMYSGSTPASHYAEYPALTDIVPLVSDTQTVLAHVRRMTERLRAELRGTEVSDDKWAAVRLYARREAVSSMEALRDLVINKADDSEDKRKNRIVAIASIRTEAQQMLTRASVAYRNALRVIVQERKSEQRNKFTSLLRGDLGV